MEEKPKTNPYVIPASIVLAGVLIAGAVIYSNSGVSRIASVKPSSPASEKSNIDIAKLADDDPSLGNPEAPVTIVEFSDFQCPFCRRLFLDTLPQIREKYLKTGKARFVYRDFPLAFHEMAQKYAEAGECADEQGKFWAMHDKIFEEQNKRGTGTISGITVADVKRWARDIGLDGGKFDECLDSGKYAQEVQKDYNDGQAAGVTGTPGTFVNGRYISGAVPFAQFEAIIEEELAKRQ